MKPEDRLALAQWIIAQGIEGTHETTFLEGLCARLDAAGDIRPWFDDDPRVPRTVIQESKQNETSRRLGVLYDNHSHQAGAIRNSPVFLPPYVGAIYPPPADAREEPTMDLFKGSMLRSLAIGIAVVILIAFGVKPILAQDKEALIKSALSAAPPAVAETAKVVTMKGDVLREGSGPYTCFPYEGAGTAPMCLDAEWMLWADAWMNKKGYKPSRFGLAYMLAGDPPDGGASNIDPFATAATPDNQWVIEGPHVMIITPDPAMLEGISTDLDAGGPYVMWKGTPYAHIMMPTGPRPK